MEIARPSLARAGSFDYVAAAIVVGGEVDGSAAFGAAAAVVDLG